MRLLETRVSPEGGFSPRTGEPFRTDATAWAILALRFFDSRHTLLDSARTRLAQTQAGDGSVSVAADHQDAYWPTAISVLAWGGEPVFESHHHRGIQFLLNSTGRRWVKGAEEPIQHDPNIPGWSWIADTHSWVEPTALAICALRSSGLAQHQRVADGVRLLMDRQLPKGGWNYGNTKVFGSELHPDPESTGAALQALSGLASYQDIRKSLDYLKAELVHVRTPVNLGWSLLGLGAWGEAPTRANDLIDQTLGRQDRYGSYDTASLALLLLPLVAPEGILAAYSEHSST
jgi:hypothetical protein